jgi:hypothetical protein
MLDANCLLICSLEAVPLIENLPEYKASWLIAARPSSSHAPPDELHHFLTTLTTYVCSFDSPANHEGGNLEFIKAKFGYPEKDIEVPQIFCHPLPTLTRLSHSGMAQDRRVP